MDQEKVAEVLIKRAIKEWTEYIHAEESRSYGREELNAKREDVKDGIRLIRSIGAKLNVFIPASITLHNIAESKYWETH